MVTDQQEHSKTKPSIEIEPVLVDAAGAAAMLGISTSMFHRLLSAGRIGPRKISFGTKCKRFSVSEFKSWVQDGCKSRERWLKEMSK